MSLRTLTSFSMMGVLFLFVSVQADSIPVANYSFEDPVTAYVTPIVSDWDEIDTDPHSQNTGAFLNIPGSEAYIVNADGNQVAYLIAEQGNAFQQELLQVYQVDKRYQLTMGVGISFYSEPEDPNDPLELAFYYKDENQQYKDIAMLSVLFERRSSIFLDEFTVNLPTVQSGYGWAGKNIGIAMRSTSDLGGTWIIDNVRVEEYPSTPNFTDDAIVNFADFAMMASEWRSCDDPLTDVTGEGCVNEADLLILMEYWLENV